MAKRKVNTDPKTLSGRHIYRDDKGRVLYYNERSMVGYVIQSENVAKYRQLSSRFIIGLLGAMVGALLFEQWNLPMFLGPIIGIACWLFMEYQFRSSFLPSLVQVQHFIPKEKPKLIEGMARETKGRLALKVVLYFAFAVLLLVDVYYFLEVEMMIIVACWLIAIFATAIAAFNAYVIFYQKKHPEILIEPTIKKGRKAK